MGYEIIETETLKPEAFPGVEVVAKVATTFEEFAAIQRLGVIGGGDTEGADKMDEALRDFAAKFIESWNIESKGQPVPVTDIHRIPLPMKVAIVAEWMRLIRTPAAPLGQESSSGLDSPEEPTTEPESE